MSKLKASIGLINPKSPTNVGGVLRAAGCYDAKQVYFTGNRYLNAQKFHTDTKNVVERIPLTSTDSLEKVKPEGATVVVVVQSVSPLPPRRCEWRLPPAVEDSACSTRRLTA